MSFSYINKLNIPVKHPGSILRSYEYNATVDKINEIANYDNELTERVKETPIYRITTNYEHNYGNFAKPIVLLDDDNTRLYPFTQTSYIVTPEGMTIEEKIVNLEHNAKEYTDDLVDRNRLVRGAYIDIDRYNRINVKNDELATSIGENIVDNETTYFGSDNKIHTYKIYENIGETSPVSKEFVENVTI